MFQFLCGARTVTCRTVFGGAIFAQVSKSPYQGVCSVTRRTVFGRAVFVQNPEVAIPGCVLNLCGARTVYL